MNNEGQSAKKSGHLVILLAVVGLVAFSSAMKDLSQLHQFALEASDLVASRFGGPAKVAPRIEIAVPAVEVETCELNRTLDQSIPSIELPWLDDVAGQKIEVKKAEAPQLPEPPQRARVQVARRARSARADFDPVQFEVRISDHAAEPEVTVPTDFSQFSFKTRTRKPNVIRVSPREILLKTLNRSINLRIAS